MFKNWRTTIGGLLAVGLFIAKAFGVEIPFHIDPAAAGLLLTGAIGVAAKDSNK